MPAHISKVSGLSTVVAGSNKGTRRKAMALGIVIAAVLEKKVARRSLPRVIDSLFRNEVSSTVYLHVGYNKHGICQFAGWLSQTKWGKTTPVSCMFALGA